MKLSKKYSTILFAVFVSLGMSFCMSLALTAINLGFVSNFLEKWARAFAIGFIISVPTSLLMIPPIRRIVDKLTSK